MNTEDLNKQLEDHPEIAETQNKAQRLMLKIHKELTGEEMIFMPPESQFADWMCTFLDKAYGDDLAMLQENAALKGITVHQLLAAAIATVIYHREDLEDG